MLIVNWLFSMSNGSPSPMQCHHFSQGVLKPAEDLGLREDQRVHLIVETVDDRPTDRAAALARLRAGIAKMQFFSQGPVPSREELHDRS